MVVIKHLHKTYKAKSKILVKALQGISLTIKESEFTAIVGPSGSGKSTLLNIIGGLDQPDSGQVIINNTDLSTLNKNQLTKFRLDNIGFVFQAYNLVPVLTAEENIRFIMELQGKPKKEIKAQTKYLLDKLGLFKQAKSRPSELSGGQQQRVAVARALASNPKFILADEPTSNLDTKSSQDLLDLMQKLNEDEGTTFIFSTHDQRIVQRTNRIVYLEDGKIVDI